YTLKNNKNEPEEEEEVQDLRCEVYKTILSIEEMQDSEVPMQIKAEDETPDEAAEFLELKAEIIQSIKRLPARERDLIESKFFREKKLREISDEFDISQSRISRIIQTGLDKVKRDLKRRGVI
ncbi:MAG: sigma-70 family RNA polymerase sigma factor, partial [Alphaproteobacteria bacterium]|nr:sigma-70 family RNA polymerase sigma factor [Alphaproteobacteria bacterium]